MDFITIGQYFNKLQSAIFTLLIVPLLAFATLYFFQGGLAPDPRREYFIVIGSAVFLDWMMALLIFNKKIKSVRKEQALGTKLDKYFKLTIVRYSILSSASLLLAGGLFLTRMDIYTALYLGGLMLSTGFWPTSRKVSNDLRLKGDERQMVYYKKDKL